VTTSYEPLTETQWSAAYRPYRVGASQVGMAVSRRLAYMDMPMFRVAEVAGITREYLTEIRLGRLRPSLKVASRLSEVLTAPVISHLTVEARTKECRTCGRSFIAGNPKRVYCDQTCAQRSHIARRKGKNYRALANQLADERAALHASDAAVMAFCKACEWDGICKDAMCALVDVSPLPLVTEKVA